MYFRVTLLNNKIDKSFADIVVQQNGTFSVYSENQQLKSHLELLVQTQAFIMAPVANNNRVSSDGVFRVIPGNLYFSQALPEVLAWRGYNAKLINESHKSFLLLDSTLKAVSDDNIYYNEKQERIVKRVPQGMIAVSTDGRTVAAGRWLNANIDKEGATWTLYPNPYEQLTPEEREIPRKLIRSGMQKYHPGLFDKLYNMRTEEDDKAEYFVSEKPPTGPGKISLFDYYKEKETPSKPQEKQEVPEDKPTKLPPGKLLYSPTLGLAINSELWPPEEGMDSEWYVFDALDENAKEDLLDSLGELYPALVPGTDKGLVHTERDMDVSSGHVFKIPKGNVRGGSTVVDISINVPPAVSYKDLNETRDDKYYAKTKKVRERLSVIRALTNAPVPGDPSKRQLSPELKKLKLDGLKGTHGNWRMDFSGDREYQMAGVLDLVEESRYEAFGGPKGWNGAFLNWQQGSGKVSPLDEVVYTPSGKSTIGDITIGDYVMSERGTPVEVIGYFPHTDWQFYTVTFNDGTSVEVGKEHLWFTQTYRDRRERDCGSVKTTEEIMETLYYEATQGPVLNHSIQITEPVRFVQEHELAMDAYTLGVLLSGGKMDASIPKEYLYAALENRISLLQGLMDTSGYVTSHTGADYVTISPRLTEDVRELVLGLGGRAILSGDGERLTLSFPEGIGFNPFRLPRKANAFGYHEASTWKKFVVSIEPSRVSNGACILVDSDSHLYLTRDYIVTHNTAVVTAANTILRNRGTIIAGEQTTLMTVPNKNTRVTVNEITKFTGTRPVVIDGDRDSRVSQWEDLLDLAEKKQLPPYVVTGGSKFRLAKRSEDTDPDVVDEDEQWELSIDSQYMKLLALGGRTGSKEVRGSHIGVLVVDESGQYVNTKTARYQVLIDTIKAVSAGHGINWMMSGDISGNSAADTVSQLAMINGYVRENYEKIVNEYTDHAPGKGGWASKGNFDRRVWKRVDKSGKGRNGAKDFATKYGSQIYNLSMETIAGENLGLTHTEPVVVPLGKNWASAYRTAARKLAAEQADKDKEGNVALGLTTLLVGASYGALSPARMLEYDLAVDEMMKDVYKVIRKPEERMQLAQELAAFREKASTVLESEVGRVGAAIYDVNERNVFYEKTVSKKYRDALQYAVSAWTNPWADKVIEMMKDDLASNKKAGEQRRIGTISGSRVALEALYKRAVGLFNDPDKFLINIITGDTKPEQVAKIQEAHEKEKKRDILEFVTTAGMFGLSLPSERSFQSPLWNPATVQQAIARFNRKADQKTSNTEVMPSGVAEYMSFLQNSKKVESQRIAGYLNGMDVDDSTDEMVFVKGKAIPAFSLKMQNFPIDALDH